MKKMFKFIPLMIAPALALVACASANDVSASENSIVTDNAITTFKVTVDFDGGTVGGLPSKQYTVRKGTLYEYYKTKLPKANDITYADHTFKHYSATRGGTEIPNTYQFNGDTTIFAVYDPVKPETTYSVTWKNHSGTTLLEETNFYHTSETPTYKGETPTIDDPTPGITYEFDGWDPEPTPFAEGDPARTYTAKYKEVTSAYTVSFDTQDGSSVTAQQVNKGGKATRPTVNPTKTGYDFDDWYDAATDGTVWNFDTRTITADTTIYAHWKDGSNVRTITFDPKNGGETFTKTVRIGERLAAPTVPTYAGHKFDGWFTAASGGDQFNFDTKFEAGTLPDSALYAHWTADPTPATYYTVTFDTQGGSSIEAKKVESGKTVEQPSNPSKTGSTFGGWYKDATFADDWDFSTDTVTKNTILYAKWTINKFSVTFKTDGGTWVTGGGTGDKIVPDINYGDMPNPGDTLKKDGATFVGWSPDLKPVTAAGDVYTAQWVDTKTYYTVTFDTQGGSSIEAKKVESGKTVEQPSNPSKTGSTFGGWYKDTTFADDWDFSTDTVTKNTILYAKWTINKFSVTFKTGGGTWVTGGGTGDKIVPDINYGDMPNPGDTLKRDGYTFTGWDKTLAPVTKAGDEYTAQWAEAPKTFYTVTFDTQDGSSIPAQTIESGKTATQPTSTPTKIGYDFDGWWDASIGGTAWAFTTKTITSNTTIYAHWKNGSNLRTITFDKQDGSGTPTFTEEVRIGERLAAPAVPTYAGHKFLGWFDASTGGTEFNFNTVFSATTLTGNALYAHWSTDKCTVTFDTQGGSAVASQEIDYGAKASKPTNPTKDGYKTFSGWYNARTGGTAWNFDTAVTKDITLYAHWDDPLYHIRWFNADVNRTLLDEDDVEAGVIPQYSEDETTPLPEPTLAPDVNHRYKFNGWSPMILPVDADMSYYATYDFNDDINFSYSSIGFTLDDEFEFESVEHYGGYFMHSFGSITEENVEEIKGAATLFADGVELDFKTLLQSGAVAIIKIDDNSFNLMIDVSYNSPSSALRDATTISVRV